jgi:hypothetical protein
LGAIIPWTMKLYLIKLNTKTADFVLLETDRKFVRKTTGKVNKSGIGNSTLNAGTDELAIKEVERQAQEFRVKGYKDATIPDDFQKADIVFDKAKWHINEDFPKDLNDFQSYIHSGLFVCWLVDKGLIENDFEQENGKEITDLKLRQISPVTFYHDCLDGVFTSDGLTKEGIEFTKSYFDFETGKFMEDYLKVFDANNELSSVFHVTDTWDNYDKIKQAIDSRYELWMKEWRKE